MIFKSKDPFKKLKRRIGSHKVLDRREDLVVYSVDASYTSPPGNHDPDIVILAETTDDVIAAVHFALEKGMRLIPRGTGTGMSSGAVPLGGGMVLSTERMKRIIDLNVNGRWIQCEPGLTTAEVKDAASKHRLFYPPDPSSYKISSIGGNIAENAGGLRCVKYGTTKDYILGLKYVDAEGELHTTGVLNPDPQPLDLTPIIIGSEGLFGIIVEARLALIPAPRSVNTVLAHFPDMYQAIDAIHTFLPELVPSVCEFMDQSVIEAIRGHDPYPFPQGTEAALLIETDGDSDQAQLEADRVREVLEDFSALEIHQANDPTQRERLWNLRRLVSPALSRIADGKMNEDVVVPIGEMGNLLQRVTEVAEEYNLHIPIYGHAGDGNLHLNVMYDKSDQKAEATAHEAITACFKIVVNECGGTISGEHGIGAAKNRYMNIQFSDDELVVLKSLKDAFDKDRFLNPFKVLPPSMR